MAQPTTTPKIEELRFRLKTDPKNRLFYVLAEELRRIGQFGDAEKVLRTGLTHHPTYLSAWVSLGRVLREQKKDRDAIESLSKALQLDPGNVVAARLLADAYLATGEKVEAIKKYKLCQALLPADEELEAIIGRLDLDLKGPATMAPPPEPEPVPASEEVAPSHEETPAAGAEPRQPTMEVPAPQPDEFREFPTSPFAQAEETGPRAEHEQAPADEASLGSPSAVFSDEPQPLAGVESPFGSEESVFAEASRSLESDANREAATGDAEPMSAKHDQSPFEDPVSSYSDAAEMVEAPSGIQVEWGPSGAELPSDLSAGLPDVESDARGAEPADAADVFAPEPSAADAAPRESEPVAATGADGDDVTATLTMADLYTRQGLVDDARQIYENILARHPDDENVRRKLEALGQSDEPAESRNPKITRLEKWLSRVGRREVTHV